MDARSWTRSEGVRRWAGIVLLVNLLGLLNFSIASTTWLAEHDRMPLKYPLLWEMTGAYSFLAVLSVMLAVFRRFPLERGHLARRMPLYAGVFVVLTVVHTLLMWGSRIVLHGLLGWGPYDYGDMRYRFLMEGQKLFLGFLGVYFLVAFLAASRRGRERALAAVRLERQLTEARLQALKMQLNPHFLFNALNMIASHVYDDPRTAEVMIGHLSDFLRLTLKSADAQEVPLESELAFLQAYLAIMKARFEERLEVAMDVPPEARSGLVPHLILQPLVENAVAHCMDDPGRPGRIRVSAAREGDRLRVRIEDNGPGSPGGLEEALGRGVGLSNTASRLRHLYGDGHRLAMTNLDAGGLRVELELPFRTAA
ncbi:MAG TPA: histidine kinase [Candidatus Acidoferrum sp.]|nr:histidine kinase [Candidatus Acidoferrum sp.]